MKPHKHAKLIKAWADGATIEVFIRDGEWYTLNSHVCWEEDNIYRIKPTPEYRQLVEGEIIEKGDEYCDITGKYWLPFELFVGAPADRFTLSKIRTTRPAPAPKPEVKPDVVKRLYVSTSGDFMTRAISSKIKPANLKLTFDGETNQLKSAEVIKQ